MDEESNCFFSMVNCRLREVNLAMNGFDNEGAFAVADIIKKNITLLKIDVSYNRIGTPGAQVIAKALENNDSLKILKIGNNPLGVEGAKMLLKAVHAENSLITELDLSCVEVDKEFRELQKEFKAIKEVNIKHGIVIGDYEIKIKERLGKFPVPAEELTGSNAMNSIKQYCEENNIKLADALSNIDKNKDNKVTLLEFMDTIKNVGIVLTDGQRDSLLFALEEISPSDQLDYSFLKK
ncbi:hypothetical protein KUTeg_013763 [Tegillarca granosa]|uniref:EF-hand domain-containing protein n=1 Tax=Tegillarca granosa TaxID=220873 RepID=A0ABQ9EUN2_TEGGR|nr:hypothetical protein KUTeg_013763 [Tegillarca granosa]